MGFDRSARCRSAAKARWWSRPCTAIAEFLQAGALLVIMSGLADYTAKILKLMHFAF